MPQPTPEGYLRVYVSRRRGKAHLVMHEGRALTTLCGVVGWSMPYKQAEVEKRNLCEKCQRKATPSVDKASGT